jgi:outer membrane protein assembly factor BamB/tetratricopeptide (TPR) repeat protein
MDSGKRVSWLTVLAVVLLWHGAHPIAEAADQAAADKKERPQEAAPANGDADKANAEKPKGPNVFVPADRAMLQLLDRARLLLQEDRYAEAVRCLGAILDSSEDYFFQPGDRPNPLSLKSEALRLLGGMPRAGSELYELQYGARARQMLNEAAAARDVQTLAEVSRRFYHTRAGYEATLLLGLDHMDHGRWLAGALVLQRLRDTSAIADQFEPTLSLAIATCWSRAGAAERAQEALVELKTRTRGSNVTVAGKDVALFTQPAEAIAWLGRLIGRERETDASKPNNWAMRHGNAARNAVSFASGPLLSLRWRVPTTDHPYIEALIKQLQETNHDRDEWAVPQLHPLVVDDIVLMRNAQTLVAVDFATGKRLWEVPVADPFESLLNPPPDSPFQRGPQLEQGLRSRLWGDATYGTLSSDGKLVFAIEDLPIEMGGMFVQSMFFRGQRQGDDQGPKSYSRLAAYDVHTGKLRWHLGGSSEEFGLPQAGAFFLGPPLPLMDQLFAIAEVKGEIRLLALEAKTGNLLWSQQLADVDRQVLNDPLRRQSGVSPSYADGILVCPTSNRSIVAVELASRSLLWGYTYAPESDANQQAMLFPTNGMIDAGPAGRWTDSSAVIAEGRVIATPVESEGMYCLNLVDGKLVWKQPRQDDLYLACVHQGKAVLVGKQRVRALKLADGQTAWAIDLPTGSRPTGSGYLSGNVYHVPLTSAEVMAIDLEKGRVENLFKSRRGSVPGNLVCYKGMVVSQRADAVEVFYQLDALKNLVDQRLAGSPNDPAALRFRGEIFWHQGQLREAIAAFQQSLKASADPSTRDLLRDAYFDGLETDFANHSRRVAEIEPLIDNPCQRAAFLRLMALGLEHTGEIHGALDQYTRLIELDHRGDDLDQVNAVLNTRRDRWVQARLAILRERGPEATRTAVDQLAEARLKAAQKEGTADALQGFLDYFDTHPLADKARQELVHKLHASGRLLEAELLLLRQSRSADRSRAAGAVAELADMLRSAGRFREAALCYARLRDELADVPSLNGKTGRELATALPSDDSMGRWLQPPTWPLARVDITRNLLPQTPTMAMIPQSLEFVGRRGPFFDDVSVELIHTPAKQLLARDGLGNPLWQMAMSDIVGSQDPFSFSRSMMRLTVTGHLMLVSMADKLMAVDTLTGSSAKPRVLWKQDLKGAVSGTESEMRLGRVMLANVGGRRQRIHISGGELPINMPEMVSEQLLCLRQYHRCLALDPATGEVLWQRQDIRPDSIVFGDHEYIFVVTPGETKAKVLRALDGEVVGQREVPAPLERESTFGRRVLVWQDDGDQGTLKMIDLWTGEHVWPAKRFPGGAQMRRVGDNAVALFEPGGRFLLVNLADGRALVDAKLTPEPPLCELFVFHSPGQYLVLTQGPESDQDENRHIHPLSGTSSQRITKAHVYAFDAHGKSMWAKPVVIDDQFLPMDQPSQLPVLFFAATVQERKKGQRVTTSNTVLLGIDKRNGHEICNEAIRNGSNGLTLTGDPQKRTVEIRLQRDTLTLTFTDDPATASQAIWKAIHRAVLSPVAGRKLPSKQPEKQPGERQDERKR